MKIVADENLERPIVRALRMQGHQVLYIAEDEPGLQDSAVLQRAADEHALLITRDKDFRQLIFSARRPSWGVLHVRLLEQTATAKAAQVAQVIAEQGESLYSLFTSLSDAGLQVEPLPQQ